MVRARMGSGTSARELRKLTPNGVDPCVTSRTLSPPDQFRHGPAICGRQMETVMILEKTQRLTDLA